MRIPIDSSRISEVYHIFVATLTLWYNLLRDDSYVSSLIVTVVSLVTICFSAVPARADTNTEDLNQELPDGVTVQVMTTDADVLAQRALNFAAKSGTAEIFCEPNGRR